MDRSIGTLISEQAISERVTQIADQINQDYAQKNLFIVPVLSGSFIFAADLMRRIRVPLRLEFLGLRSYNEGTETSGNVNLYSDVQGPLSECDVLVIEDIVDTGLTAHFILEHLAAKKPRSLRLAALLHKPSRERIKVHIDYCGFTIDDHFVVGYGMDFEGTYRHLPYIGHLVQT